jgi:hypothetical protein
MVEEFDKSPPSFPDTSRVLRVIYEAIARKIRKAFEQRPPSFDARRIDEAVKQALQGHRGFGGSVGDEVQRYVASLAERWARDLQSGWPLSNSELDREMAHLLQEQAPKPGEGRIFQRAMELMTAELKDLVWIDDAERVRHLAPILNLAKAQGRLAVATLNYDNAIEQLAKSQGVSCDTGIEAWTSGGEASFDKEGISLLKLHGSIDWTWAQGELSKERPMPHRLVRQVDAAAVKNKGMPPCVIFGQRNKLTAEGPFLDLLRAFQRELARADTLTVVGYSFRDLHINVYISHWLNGDPKWVLQVVSGPRFPEDSGDIEYAEILLSLLQRIPDRIKVVAEKAGPGLKRLYGERNGNVCQMSVDS